MTFNYDGVFNKLRSELPESRIDYKSCTEGGRTFAVDKRTRCFAIRAHILEPTFNEYLIGDIVVSKALLRGASDEVVALLKRSLEEMVRDAVQKRLASSE